MCALMQLQPLKLFIMNIIQQPMDTEKLAFIISEQLKYERMDMSYFNNLYENIIEDLKRFAPGREIVSSSNKMFGAIVKKGEYFQYFLLPNNTVYIANKFF